MTDQNKLTKFWHELKRRKVVNVIIVYATTAFIIMQLANVLEPALNLPQWFDTVVTLLLIIGFPIVIIFSWIFDISSKGITKTESRPVLKEVKEEKTAYKNSIAVLPFQDLSPLKDQEYFCDGMAEEIINVLSHIEDLKVIARTSAFMFKGRQEDMRKIGKKLGVEHLLEGSIRKAQNHLRITAQLIKVNDGSHLWSENFDRKIEDIFAIQDEIALAIAEVLKLKLLKTSGKEIKKKYTENMGAYESYLMGKYYFGRWEFDSALLHLNKAIEKDRNLALAYAAKAEIYWLSGLAGIDIIPQEAIVKARDAISVALIIDNKLAEAYVSSGLINLYMNRNWSSAQKDFEKAEELNPNSPKVYHGWTDYYLILGKVDLALEYAKRAAELDPMFLEYLHHIGGFYAAKGMYKETMEIIDKTEKLDPDNFYTYLLLSWYHGYQKNSKEIIRITENALEKGLFETTQLLFRLGYWYGISGNKKKAREILENMLELKKSKYVSSTYIAFIYSGLNDKDAVFEWLDKAYTEIDPQLVLIKLYHEIYLYPVRSDKRYSDLLEKLGLK